MGIPIRPKTSPSGNHSEPRRDHRQQQRRAQKHEKELELPDFKEESRPIPRKERSHREEPAEFPRRKEESRRPQQRSSREHEDNFRAPQKSEEEVIPEGWVKDKKTGKIYKPLPKSKFVGKGANAIPVLVIKDFNDLDLNGEANKFLAHLRVPPDKKEQEELRKLRAQQKALQDSQYNLDVDED